ncbi:uncharacterized protein UV8b_07804 [Ustilaginoidea virens]|uniref:Thioredoxin n=1 Tax=Ustilaginoidea virens TaxID=1159556 RepID=A0A8E5HXY3_USTVR|nr:uncharacterized protein UV8b_07804 [Ustilaginoidea virens]QUC23563.1 hypothetical protein UV8b_07804 [Ustilaginoidea virens]
MPVITVTSKQQFDQLIRDTDSVAIQASAAWCGPCKAISPLFEKHSDALAADHAVAFAKFDIDQVPDLAQELGVTSVPTFYFFSQAERTSVVTGANPGSLKTAVDDLTKRATGTAFSTTENF